MTDEAKAVLRGLAGADDPFDDESIELVSGEIGVDPGLVRLRVCWSERLGRSMRGMGRPSLAPGRYVRLLLVGYVEGLDSERAIA